VLTLMLVAGSYFGARQIAAKSVAQAQQGLLQEQTVSM